MRSPVLSKAVDERDLVGPARKIDQRIAVSPRLEDCLIPMPFVFGHGVAGMPSRQRLDPFFRHLAFAEIDVPGLAHQKIQRGSRDCAISGSRFELIILLLTTCIHRPLLRRKVEVSMIAANVLHFGSHANSGACRRRIGSCRRTTIAVRSARSRRERTLPARHRSSLPIRCGTLHCCETTPAALHAWLRSRMPPR